MKARPTVTAVMVVDWRTLTAVGGPYTSVEAARHSPARSADPGRLGVVAVPVAWLPDLPRHLGDWLAGAPDRYAAALTVQAEPRPDIEEVPA